MSDFILHHYALSPFSEKIRLMLGHSGLDWRSAISPAMPPRPMVDPLAGGYRKIPVAQIGADIFCDTRIISAEVANITDHPLLAMENCDADAQDFSAFVDSKVFMANVVSGSPGKSLWLLLTHFTPWSAWRFMKDRAGVQKTSKMERLSPQQGLKIVRQLIDDMDDRLTGHDFLFGDAPCIADFSAYHVLWFRDKTRGNHDLRKFSNLQRWWRNMAEFGHGQSRRITRKEVLDQARAAEPRSLTPHAEKHQLDGAMVQIQPADYARTPVQGTLLAADQQRYILARETDDLGTLHVHFPVDGYEIAAL